MSPGAVIMVATVVALLALWSVLGVMYFFVMALLERSDSDDECEAPLEALERQMTMERHPAGHRR